MKASTWSHISLPRPSIGEICDPAMVAVPDSRPLVTASKVQTVDLKTTKLCGKYDALDARPDSRFEQIVEVI
jgi:hypothetical protein